MRPSKRTLAAISIAGVLAVLGAVLAGWSTSADQVPGSPYTPASVKVERVYSGHKIKTNDGRKFRYAGIRAPYRQEPLFEEARRRNEELVVGQRIRLRFDEDSSDDQGHPEAYAFVDGQMVNELLVREGLAYVRLTPQVTRFSERLLAAQKDARRQKSGLWQTRKRSSKAVYPADPKYGTFHRQGCEEVARMKASRRRDFRSATQAFDQGFAPCPTCQP